MQAHRSCALRCSDRASEQAEENDSVRRRIPLEVPVTPHGKAIANQNSVARHSPAPPSCCAADGHLQPGPRTRNGCRAPAVISEKAMRQQLEGPRGRMRTRPKLRCSPMLLSAMRPNSPGLPKSLEGTRGNPAPRRRIYRADELKKPTRSRDVSDHKPATVGGVEATLAPKPSRQRSLAQARCWKAPESGCSRIQWRS